MNQVINCNEVSKYYGNVKAVEKLSFDLEDGEIISLLGPSGCGKSTALRMIAGFIRPDNGTIEIEGRYVDNDSYFVPPEKRNVGIIFQDFALFPHLNVYDNITFGITNGIKSDIARKLITLLGMDGLEYRKPSELSGGQQQRVAIARALAPNPCVLLMDEPFSNLDKNLRTEIRTEIRDILKSNGISVIFVTHDNEEAFFMGDRVAIMEKGELIQLDTPYEIYHNPENKFIACFAGSAGFLPVKIISRKAVTTIGIVDLPRDCNVDGDLEIMIRPDNLYIKDIGNGPDKIIDSIFLGDSYLYTVQLSSGSILKCMEHHSMKLNNGSMVSLALSPHHTPPFFVNGKRIC